MENAISAELKSELLGELLNARMQHTRWITGVIKNEDFHVEENHTQCQFGKWMIRVNGLLKNLDEFQQLDLPHKDLHRIFLVLKHNRDHQMLRGELKTLSKELIKRIDALETRLNQIS